MKKESPTSSISSRKKADIRKAIQEGLDSANKKELVAHELMEPLFLEQRINTLRLMDRRKR